ncbi:ferredoxin family protein [Candidatus Cryosericum odellii]|uniref:4Fe-4S ferredoxin-type domain-containing protein n=1 Tax=Candidatus Cryosericum odellii TaxID=2290917 RepID=A0A398DEL7_9BACT|nr:hypothetical protein SMC6_08555 [Candidatus Cryosericum odellii]RIE09621.1 hypothetical protein SMC5_06935 [Candidatus Cryosericum odellii]
MGSCREQVTTSHWQRACRAPRLKPASCEHGSSCLPCFCSPAQSCPVSCLGLGCADPRDHHARPVLKMPDRCIGCGFCADSCPVGAITMR